jgi:hypothetical protein
MVGTDDSVVCFYQFFLVSFLNKNGNVKKLIVLFQTEDKIS